MAFCVIKATVSFSELGFATFACYIDQRYKSEVLYCIFVVDFIFRSTSSGCGITSSSYLVCVLLNRIWELGGWVEGGISCAEDQSQQL
jgi:hypothetical protein